MSCGVEEPSFLSINDPIPGISMFMEGYTTTGSSQEKNTVINSILQHMQIQLNAVFQRKYFFMLHMSDIFLIHLIADTHTLFRVSVLFNS